MKRNLLISLGLIGLILAGRLIPHVWNVAPVAAAALLAGAILPRKWAIAVPILGMLLGDLIIGFYHVPVMLTVYASFALMTFVGGWLKEMQTHRMVLASLASSTFFFLTTNFAVWASADWYEKSWQGLMLCYTLALPFFRNTMLGDLIFTGALFGVWVLVRQGVTYLGKIRILEGQLNNL
jgi:hypothetical protein